MRDFLSKHSAYVLFLFASVGSIALFWNSVNVRFAVLETKMDTLIGAWNRQFPGAVALRK